MCNLNEQNHTQNLICVICRFDCVFCKALFHSFTLCLCKHSLLLVHPVQFRNVLDNFVMSLAKSYTHLKSINISIECNSMTFSGAFQNNKNFIEIQFCFVFLAQSFIRCCFCYFAFLFENKKRSVNEALTLSLNRLFYLYSTSFSLANHRIESLSSIIADYMHCVYRTFDAPFICVRCRSLNYFQVRF